MKNAVNEFILLCILTVASAAHAASGAVPVDLKWDEGAEDCVDAQKHVQAQHYDETTVIIRQNPCVDYEANLLYLLLGEQRALLVDTGAVEDAQLAGGTAEMVASYLKDPAGARLPLLVVHTHGHMDHRAGDAQFAALPGVEIAPVESALLRKFFGFTDWPNGLARIDLGGRVVQLIPTPGHHEDHIVFYDERTGLLLTGDFLLPGRLLVDDLDAYRASAERVADFANTHPVSAVLGAHIELDANGNAYPSGATHHPNERTLTLTKADVLALPAALAAFNGFYSRHPNFIVVNPIHNLSALALGVVVALTLLAWIARRLWRRRRAIA
jgi:hydroxyacylglutathione hydrolase